MPISCHFRDCKSAAGHESDSCKWRCSKCPDLYLYLKGGVECSRLDTVPERDRRTDRIARQHSVLTRDERVGQSFLAIGLIFVQPYYGPARSEGG